MEKIPHSEHCPFLIGVHKKTGKVIEHLPKDNSKPSDKYIERNLDKFTNWILNFFNTSLSTENEGSKEDYNWYEGLWSDEQNKWIPNLNAQYGI